MSAASASCRTPSISSRCRAAAALAAGRLAGREDGLRHRLGGPSTVQAALAALVRDHFAILKVGPGVTFALREILWALVEIENEIGVAPPESLKDVVRATMQRDPRYEDAPAEVAAFLRDRIAVARAAGIEAETVIPTRRPMYALAAPKTMPSTTPVTTALSVNSASSPGRGSLMARE